MSAPTPSAEELQRLINAKGNEIKTIKKEKTAAAGAKGLDKNDPEIAAHVAQLNALKAQLAAVQLGDPAEVARLAALKAAKDAALATRTTMESIFTSRGFFFPSNEIHNPPAGFFDFGPVGCAIKQNLLQFWRNWFVLTEGMLEIECPTMTPESVFRASGHVAKFTDFMVTEVDPAAADAKDAMPVSYRADKLVEEFTEKVLADEKEITTLATTLNTTAKELRAELEKVERDAGAMNAAELDAVLKRFSLKSPTGKDLSPCFAFNLMFASQIGPSGKSQGYLRPETAQGMFVNFRRLYDLNSGRMPFAAAQIGPAFRNEIAPRQGLLRVREFTLAEIEHFVHPDDKRHANFAEVADLELLLLPRDAQERGEMQAQKIKASRAVGDKIIGNETLAYFMARTQTFLLKCGIIEAKLRFRQHKATEMAHYASDCWDAEILTSYGWIECVGHADRAAFDLDVHSKATGADLTAQETYATPKQMQVAKFDIKNPLIGKAFGKKGPEVTAAVRALKLDDALALEAALAKDGQADVKLASGEVVQVKREQVFVSTATTMVHTNKYTPHVIEPAFGVGRIFYAILEHTFYVRQQAEAAAAAAAAAAPAKGKEKDAEADKRTVFSLPAFLAPSKLSILPLSSNAEFVPAQRTLSKDCVALGVSFKVDASSGSIGRRYARADEIGIPFGVTIDFQTKEDGSVTIRERDSMQQIRVPIAQAVPLVQQLTNGQISWAQAYETHPKFTSAPEKE